MIRTSAALILLAFATVAVAQTADQVKELQSRFKAERAAAAEQKFAPALLEPADKLAARAETALAAGQLQAAASAIREARWHLPALPADLAANVSRVLGSAR